MFDYTHWRITISTELGNLARNPRQELQLAGSPTLLAYLTSRAIDPFFDAFQSAPIEAVLALSRLTHTPSANDIVLWAARTRYQTPARVERELRANRGFRCAAEQLLVELQVIPLLRQRLSSAREQWMRTRLERELLAFGGEFTQLRRVLNDTTWQARYESLRGLQKRNGRFSPADLVLIHDGMSDGAAYVRAASARALGQIAVVPPLMLTNQMLRLALHDPDVETRTVAARALGRVRERIITPGILSTLDAALQNPDAFVRSSAALVVGHLGELAAIPSIIARLVAALQDADTYVREAAARAIGQLGEFALTVDVIRSLEHAAAHGDLGLHEAASEALQMLRRQKPLASLSIGD